MHREREFFAQIHLAGRDLARKCPREWIEADGRLDPRLVDAPFAVDPDGRSNRGAGTRQGPPDSPTQTNRNSMSISSA